MPEELQAERKMRLGLICPPDPQTYAFAVQNSLMCVEHAVNEDDVAPFMAQTQQIARWLKEEGAELSALARFGRNLISDDTATRDREVEQMKRLVDAAAELGARTCIMGAGPAEDRSLQENAFRTIDLFDYFCEYAQKQGVRIACYTSRWENWCCTPTAWNLIMEKVPLLGIKYDPSHAFYAGDDYLWEMRDWGRRIFHVHAKGALRIAGDRFDDPPPGMDQIQWGNVLAVLHYHGYDGDIMIEPHSLTWAGPKFSDGILIAARHLKQFLA